MKAVLATLLSTALLTAVGGAIFIYSGIFNVAATEPHWPASYWVLEKARMRSIQVRGAGLTPPAGYDEPSKVAGAAGHFSEHCATCHGGPGIKPSVWAEGMYPTPPNLKEVASRYTPGELFWILKNGIKMSAMPSMASDGDEMLWSTVAFLEKLPALSEDDFNDLWMTAQAAGSMNMDHGAMMNGESMDHGTMQMQGGSTSSATPSPESKSETAGAPTVKPGGG
jgi:mono/diheme cytochrome c family protein